jgi:hemerythrin
MANNPFKWLTQYEIGCENIDHQHKNLFELANRITEATSQDAVKHCVMQLYKYVREHFRDEESLMKDLAYPNYEAHKKQHDLLLTQLVEISERMTQDGLDCLDDLIQFMNEWIVDHILKYDVALNSFMKKNNSDRCST